MLLVCRYLRDLHIYLGSELARYLLYSGGKVLHLPFGSINSGLLHYNGGLIDLTDFFVSSF